MAEDVRLALDAIDLGHPGGLAVPVPVLRDRVMHIQQRSRACQFAEVATDLPGLIRDLHTTLNTGRDRRELLDLAVYLHVHVTRLWLVHAAAPTDLVGRSVFLARRLAEEHGAVTTLAMAGFDVADVLLNGGAFRPGQIALAALTLPPTTADTASLVVLATLTRCSGGRIRRPSGRRGGSDGRRRRDSRTVRGDQRNRPARVFARTGAFGHDRCSDGDPVRGRIPRGDPRGTDRGGATPVRGRLRCGPAGGAETYSLDKLNATMECWRRIAWMTHSDPAAHRLMLQAPKYATRTGGGALPGSRLVYLIGTQGIATPQKRQ